MPRVARWKFLVAAGVFLSAPLHALAQEPVKTARVATLWTTSRAVAQPYLDEIEDGLREQGWVAGRNLVLEHWFTDGLSEALPGFAAELVA